MSNVGTWIERDIRLKDIGDMKYRGHQFEGYGVG